VAANAVAQTTEFTTGIEPDTAAPVIVRSNPFNGATGVAVNTVITVEASEPLDVASVTPAISRFTTRSAARRSRAATAPAPMGGA
jgi:hypothetical protein